MTTCPKCQHVFDVPPTWRDYLKKQPGHKVHFFSNTNTTEPRIVRTRLHFKIGTDPAVIRAALELIAIEHRHDPFFRWCDVPTNTIDEVLARL